MSIKRLNQVLAVEKTVKSSRETQVTELYRQLQKEALVTGQLRNYKPRVDGDIVYPAENKRVQVSAEAVLREIAEAWKEVANITAMKDVTNTVAVADVVVDGEVVLTGVPATHLLWLENRLKQTAELVAKLPTLSPERAWTKDEGAGVYRAEPETSLRTKKRERTDVIVPPTDKHPAQVKTTTEDVVEGEWVTVPLSGAVPLARKVELAVRIEKYQRAVKEAREAANQTDVKALASGGIFEKIFAP